MARLFLFAFGFFFHSFLLILFLVRFGGLRRVGVTMARLFLFAFGFFFHSFLLILFLVRFLFCLDLGLYIFLFFDLWLSLCFPILFLTCLTLGCTSSFSLTC